MWIIITLLCSLFISAVAVYLVLREERKITVTSLSICMIPFINIMIIYYVLEIILEEYNIGEKVIFKLKD